MDFANAVCTPKAPGCGHCPMANACRGYADDMAEQLPFKAPKRQKPTRRGVAFVAINQNGEAFMERRPEKGLLGGMVAFPSVGWTETNWSDADFQAAKTAAPFAADWRQLPDPSSSCVYAFCIGNDNLLRRNRPAIDRRQHRLVAGATA